MTKYELIALGDGIVAPGRPKAVVAAGTGLGTAGLFLIDGKWRAGSGASSFATMPIGIDEKFDFGKLTDSQGFVPAGRLLCGKGLVAVYEALGGTAPNPTPESITVTGLDDTDPQAALALDRMAMWLGRFAGEIALHFGATGGLYLAGGLPTGIVDALKKGSFRKSFEGVGERQAYLKDVSVFALKTAADPGLRGAAVALANSLPKPSRNYHRLRA